jgi:hypothetical protein
MFSAFSLWFVLLAGPLGPTQNESPDLTGVWRDVNGGTYQIRQDAGHLWWYGHSDDCGKSWQNVFAGTIDSSNEIVGEWADVPTGAMNNVGTLRARLVTPTRLEIEATGGFGGKAFERADLSQAGVCAGAMRFAQAADTTSTLPASVKVRQEQGGDSRSDSAVALPANLIRWFTHEADVLIDVMRELAGEEAVREYLAAERNKQLGSDLQRVEMRSRVLEKLLLASRAQ